MRARAWLFASAAWLTLGCGSGPSAPTSCTSDRQCSGAGMVCDFARSTCVQCVAATDCAASQVCRANACVDVVACSSSRSCPGQVCDPARGYCVDCVADVDCRDGQICRDDACVAPPTACTSDRQCSGMGLVCDTTAQLCVECNVALDCSSGQRCLSDHTCGTGVDPDAGMPGDAYVPIDTGPPFVVAPHGASPIVDDQGGPRWSTPQMVVLTYDDDPNRLALEEHARWLVASSWLTDVGAEYGIGAGEVLGTVHLGASPTTISTTEIESLLAGGIASHAYPRAPDGSVDNGVIYFIYFPARTTVTTSDGSQSCVDFDGFHETAMTPGGEVYTYAVIDTCPMPSDRTLSVLENTEVTVTHELIEAATDPRWYDAPAFEMPDATYSPWLLVGAELADLCELNAGASAYVRDPPYLATRVWSNAAAAANDRDPCVPSAMTTAPYYAVTVTPSTMQPISPGGTVTFDLAGWSTGPVSNWRVDAMPSGRMFGPMVSIDRPSMNNGDHATLTVTAPTGIASHDYALIWLYASMPSDPSSYQTWPVGVYVP